MTRYNLDVREELCWGCKTCEAACKQENRAPTGVKLIRVSEDGPRSLQGRPHFVFRVNRCLHCDDPDCMQACAEGAISKREDGIVILDQSVCSGCQACLEACPHGVISFDRASGLASKCNLCYHRIDRGLLPACADNVCLSHCIFLEGAVLVQGVRLA